MFKPYSELNQEQENRLKPMNSLLKKRDMGLAGAIIVLAQVISNAHSSHNVSAEISKLREDFIQSKVERDELFTRKSDVALLNDKIDHLKSEVIRMNDHMKSLKGLVRESLAFENISSSIWESPNHPKSIDRL